jgi:hypothetical protein
MNQNIFIFVQENQLTHYSKERGYRISVTPLYIIKPNGGVLKTFAIIPWHSPNTIPTTSANGQIGQLPPQFTSCTLHTNTNRVGFPEHGQHKPLTKCRKWTLCPVQTSHGSLSLFHKHTAAGLCAPILHWWDFSTLTAQDIRHEPLLGPLPSFMWWRGNRQHRPHEQKKAKNHTPTPDPKILGCDENSMSLHLQIISMHDIKKPSRLAWLLW